MLEHAALGHAGRLVAADELEADRGLDGLVEPHAQQVEVHELTAHRMALLVLDDDRRGVLAVDAEVEHGAAWPRASRSWRASTLKGTGLALAAVDDAGHEALRRRRRVARELETSRRSTSRRVACERGHGEREG